MSAKTFKREDRYLVLKRSDIPNLSKNDQQRLSQIALRLETIRIQNGKRPMKCVVVESDWPEYETTFTAIQARVEGSPA